MEFHSGLQSIKRVTGWATRGGVHDEMFVISGFDGQDPINTRIRTLAQNWTDPKSGGRLPTPSTNKLLSGEDNAA
jgi:hypothetical protein